VAVLEQQFLGPSAGLRQRRFQPPRHSGAQFALAGGMGFSKAFEVGDDRRTVE